MPYKFQFDDKLKCCITEFFGILSNKDIVKSSKEKTSNDVLIRSVSFVFDDFTAITKIRITPGGVIDSVKQAEYAYKVNPNIKHVMAISSPLMYGMARMWQAYSHKAEWEKIIVRTRDEALEIISNANN